MTAPNAGGKPTDAAGNGPSGVAAKVGSTGMLCGIGGRNVSNLQKPTPRVEAVIAEAMAKHPGESPKALATYFEAVHQELAPLARDLERENEVLRTNLAAAVEDLKKWMELAAVTKQVSDIAIRRKERAERLGLPHNRQS